MDKVKQQSQKEDPEQQGEKPRPPSVKIRIRYGTSAALVTDEHLRPKLVEPLPVDPPVIHEMNVGPVHEKCSNVLMTSAMVKEEDITHTSMGRDVVGDSAHFMVEEIKHHKASPEMPERAEDGAPVFMEDVSSEEAADVTSSERVAALDGQHRTIDPELAMEERDCCIQNSEQSAAGFGRQKEVLRLLEEALPGLLESSELILALKAQGLRGGALDRLESSVSRIQAAYDILR
jgi:hypothetical protein